MSDIFDPEHPMNVQLREMHAAIQFMSLGSKERTAMAVEIGRHINDIRTSHLPVKRPPPPKGWLICKSDTSMITDGDGNYQERGVLDVVPAKGDKARHDRIEKGAFPRWLRECAPFGNNAAYMYLRAFLKSGDDPEDTRSLTILSKGYWATKRHEYKLKWNAMTPAEQEAEREQYQKFLDESAAAIKALIPGDMV